MCLNELMHPRNPYKIRPNFKELAVEFPEFRDFVVQDLKGNVTLDFKNRESVRILTLTLLKRDFDIDLRLPPRCLVPTLPLRFNYLLWIEDIIHNGVQFQETVEFDGIDVGVGSSCIYPLLGAKSLKWRMIGLESDDESLSFAQENVSRNDLQDKISLFRCSSTFFSILNDKDWTVTFTICNPPFYDSSMLSSSLHGDSEGHEDECSPNSPPAGFFHEMTTEGGEVTFVKNMILQSRQVAQRVAVFTCMLGHKSSLLEIKRFFESSSSSSSPSIVNWTTTEFCQGKTMRWGVAWTYKSDVMLPRESELQAKRKKAKKHAPMIVRVPASQDCYSFFKTISEWLTNELRFDVKVLGKPSKMKVMSVLTTKYTLWKNQRRRRREKLQAKRCKMDDEMEVEEDLQLSFHLNIHRFKNEIIMEYIFQDGVTGREGLHQVIQYIKNKLQPEKSD